jgi:hypothetical protein
MDNLILIVKLVTETLWAIGASIFATGIGTLFVSQGQSPWAKLSKLIF